MLVLFNIWLAMLRTTRVMDSKVQMQDQARQAMQHMTSNLRMAAILQGRDPAPPQFVNYDGGALWPPATPIDDDWSPAVNNISFVRPVAGPDGLPFANNTADINWSGVVTYQLDTGDANGDGNTLQLVQLIDGAFTRLLATDISPVQIPANGNIYDPPATGGVAFRARSDDPNMVWISIIQRRSPGPGAPDVVTRYESYVQMEN